MERRELRGAMGIFMDCNDPEVLVEGPAGTGKTNGILQRVHHDMWKYPKSRQLLCRATRVSMTESVLKTWEEQVLGDVHPAYHNSKANRENRHSYVLPHNGAVVVVAGLDNPDRLYSTEWDRVYIAESQEVSEDAFERLGRAMRNFRMPVQQRVADINPVAPGFWANRRADACEDRIRLARSRTEYNRLQEYNERERTGRMKRLVSRHMDNPAYWDLDKWDWTEHGRLYVAGTLAGMSAHRKARLFDGLWTAGEGTVFPEFNERRHTVNPFTIPDDWQMYVGIDPGYDHPCAILWLAVSDNGTIYICREIYQTGTGVKEQAKNIVAQNNDRKIRRYFADPQHAFRRTFDATKSIAQQFREAGINIAPWPPTINSEGMVDAVRTLLLNDKLKVFRTCPETIREFQTWSYKRNAKGEQTGGDDQYVDADNHAMDVIKGCVAAGLNNLIGQKGTIRAVGDDE